MNNKYDRIIKICHSLISGQTNIILGCREIVSLRSDLDLENDLDFLPFISVASETDDWPEPSIRRNFNTEYLKKIDKETNEYIKSVQETIMESCKLLISKYGSVRYRKS